MTRMSSEAIDRTAHALCDQLRPETHGYMIEVTRAAILDAYAILPLARRVLHDYDTTLTPEVFVLSLQGHYNTYYDLAFEIIDVHATDGEADTLMWLCTHYIMTHRAELTRMT